MKALVVFESVFDNSEQIASAVAEGLAEFMPVTMQDVTGWPLLQPDEYDVVVVGGPTHAFGLSTPRSRDRAVRQSGRRGHLPLGLREWLTALPAAPDSGVTAAFDLQLDRTRWLPGSAARSATKVLYDRGATGLVRPHSFGVLTRKAPVRQEELDRAREWGRALAILSGAVKKAADLRREGDPVLARQARPTSRAATTRR